MKKDIFKYRTYAKVCLYAGIGVTVLACLWHWLLILGLGLYAAFFYLNIQHWRCPYCDRGFEMRIGSMDDMIHCPFCGEKIRQ